MLICPLVYFLTVVVKEEGAETVLRDLHIYLIDPHIDDGGQA